MSSTWFSSNQVQRVRPILRRAYTHIPRSGPSGPRAVLALIIGANTLVFGAWILADRQNDRRALSVMHDRFTCSLRNIKQHRYYTLLTSAFSHQAWWHFGFNMLALHSFGELMAWAGIGAMNTVGLCLTAGIAGSAAWVYHQSTKPDTGGRGGWGGQVIRAKDMASALGASGMVMGVGAAAACFFPTAPTNLMFIPISIPLWAMVAGYFAIDTYFLDRKTGIGHAAHLGGGAAGIAFYLLQLRRFGGVGNLQYWRRRF